MVFIIGLQYRAFPSYLATNDKEMEEERRLLNVAMTRAKKLLFLSYNKYRYSSYAIDDEFVGKSSFLDELPQEYLQLL